MSIEVGSKRSSVVFAGVVSRPPSTSSSLLHRMLRILDRRAAKGNFLLSFFVSLGGGIRGGVKGIVNSEYSGHAQCEQ